MYLLENVFYGELDLSGGDIGSGDSAITLSSGDVGRLNKTPTATDPMIFTIWDLSYEHAGSARKAGGKWEIIEVTGKDAGTDTLTAGTRGFSNSSAQSYNAADNTTYGIVLVSADELYDNLLIAGSSNNIVDRAGNTLNTINAPTDLTIGGDSVVESGSNSDGKWVKYADGTMICRIVDPSWTNETSETLQGLTVYRKSYNWTFPQVFNNANVAITGLYNISGGGELATLTTNGAPTASSIELFGEGLLDNTIVYSNAVAIGTWK